MKNELIHEEICKIKCSGSTRFNLNLTDESAFEILCYLSFFSKNTDYDSNIGEAKEYITNGANDGGIDFVCLNDDNSKIIIGQCKYTNTFTPTDLIQELDKMSSTVENFRKRHTGAYSSKLKEILQNALDSLSDGNEYNVEYHVFTKGSLKSDLAQFNNKIDNSNGEYTSDMVRLYDESDIQRRIEDNIEKINTVAEFVIEIDEANNYLEYETSTQNGIMVNLSNRSLVKMYNMYKAKGLFDLNIRKYVPNKSVDKRINSTLDKNRENFWFLNNGLIIACSDFRVDGNKVKLYDFSIVNGGQTTNRIGEYKGRNTDPFFIPCKIISSKEKGNTSFYNEIAEATNSQKPIYARDLKSNSPEMLQLKNWLSNSGYNLEIKRGDKIKQSTNIKIKNDELGQMILSFVHQQPGTARSGKAKIFDNETLYKGIFKVNYEKDPLKKAFILDLIKLYLDFLDIKKEITTNNELTDNEMVVLKNGTCTILACLGIVYRYINDDIEKYELASDTERERINDGYFEYGAFISEYRGDDYYLKLKSLIKNIVRILNQSYNNNIVALKLTSVSNYFKTDARYKVHVISDLFSDLMNNDFRKDEFEFGASILRRPK